MEKQLIETERKLILELNKLDEERRQEFRENFESLERKFRGLEIQIESLQKCVSVKETAECKKGDFHEFFDLHPEEMKSSDNGKKVQDKALSDINQQLRLLEENVMKPTLKSSLCQIAIDIVTKATELDKSHRYEKALEFYDMSIDIFLNTIKYEATGELAKQAIRKKCVLYLERANKIRDYLKQVTAHS